MRRTRVVFVGLKAVCCSLLVGLLASARAWAQDDAATERPAAPFEATAFAGYRAGGTFDIPDSKENADVGEHFSPAFALDYRFDEASAYELFFSRQRTRVSVGDQRTDLDVKYFMMGGTLLIEEMSLVHPYIIGLVGLGSFSLRAPGASDDSRWSVSVGVGMRLPIRQRLDLRLEGRGYVTFVDSDSALFCRAGATDSACLLHGNGSTFVQFEALVGVAWSF